MKPKTAFIFCLLCAIVASALSDSCPDEEDLMPCTCEEEEDEVTVNCYGKEIKPDVLKKALSSLRNAKNIDLLLDDINLGSLPSNFFEGLHIRLLEISHCELSSLSADNGPALKGLEDSLEELVILSSLNDGKLELGHLRKLKEIDLSFNKITELGNDWFSNGPSSLTELTISNCGIEKLGDKAFSNLNNLKVLGLHGNRFGPIKRSMLPTYPVQLHKLELDNNDLTEIPDDLFQKMPGLKVVSLRTNRISTLEEKTWEPVYSQLNTIYLEGNPLNCDSHMDWLINSKATKAIFGRCAAPQEKAGKDLRDIINRS